MPQDDGVNELAMRIDTALHEVPEVAALFRSGSLVSNAIAIAAETLGMAGASSPVAVTLDDRGAAEVEVSIGVRTSAPLAETLHTVQGVVAAEVEAAGRTLGAARITVVHVRR